MEDAYPTAMIGVFETLAILIIPSDTFSFGPRGPSGVIPMYFLLFNNLKIGRNEILLFLLDVGMLFKLKYFPIMAPNLPSL